LHPNYELSSTDLITVIPARMAQYCSRINEIEVFELPIDLFGLFRCCGVDRSTMMKIIDGHVKQSKNFEKELSLLSKTAGGSPDGLEPCIKNNSVCFCSACNRLLDYVGQNTYSGAMRV
jgi:hypothetical protein